MSSVVAGCAARDNQLSGAATSSNAGPKTVQRCVTDGGLRTMGGRRAPDDHDAPDYELIVYSEERGLVGFVGFYSTAHRARRYEGQVRESTSEFGGSVERRGDVTLIWPPDVDGELRARVRDCLSTASA